MGLLKLLPFFRLFHTLVEMLTNALSPKGHVTNDLLSLHEPWQVLIKLACLYNEHALNVEVGLLLSRQTSRPSHSGSK